MKNLILIISLLLVMPILAQQSKNDEIITAVNIKLDSVWETSNAPGISLSVVFPDGEVETFTRGYANVEEGIKMTAQTKMLGGSTGKVFYSVVALQLVEEGKLKLDEPIFNTMSNHTWFTRIPNAKTLTVRSLLRHETGLPRYVFSEGFQKDVLKDADKVWKPVDLLFYIFDAEPQFEVGKGFAYSDTNYIILGLLIEKVTGNSLYEEVQRRVLDRAGLQQVVSQTSRTYNKIAQGYNGEEDSFYPGKQFGEDGKSRYNLQFEWAGGGLVITSHDLAILGKKIYEGQMFDPGLLKEYFNGVDADNLGGQWGLGVHIKQTPHGVTYGHSGFMPGYVTNMRYYAKHKFAIACQVNTSDQTKMSILRHFSSISTAINEVLAKE